MFIKSLSVMALLCLMASSSVEGRSYPASRHHSVLVKKKIQVISADQQKRKKAVAQPQLRRVLAVMPSRKQEALTAKKRSQRTIVAKKTLSQSIRTRPLPKQITAQRKKAPSAKSLSHTRARRAPLNPKSQIQQKASVLQKRQPSLSTPKKSSRQ